MNKLFKLLLFICFLWGNTVSAAEVAIDKEEAHNWTTEKSQEFLTILSDKNIQSKYYKLDKMLLEDVNLGYISKFVIGKYGRKMNHEQKSRYNSLFQRYVLSLYKKFNLNVNTEKLIFSIDEIESHKRFTTVNCSIDLGDILQNISEGQPQNKIPVKFKLIRGNNDKIQAVDVEISNVSMVMEYRKRFYQMIRDEDEDLNWFLDSFNDKVIANENAIYQNAGL